MKSNSLHDALAQFLENNPDLPAGDDVAAEEVEVNAKPRRRIKLHVSVEKKGRNGKVATIIDGLSVLAEEEVETLASELKKTLGTGGSWRNDEILVQGDRRAAVVKFLQSKGFDVK